MAINTATPKINFNYGTAAAPTSARSVPTFSGGRALNHAGSVVSGADGEQFSNESLPEFFRRVAGYLGTVSGITTGDAGTGSGIQEELCYRAAELEGPGEDVSDIITRANAILTASGVIQF